MDKIQTRKGAVLLWRLGTLDYTNQKRWSARAPESTGMWAFPWPYFDMFFAAHKYQDILPKRFRYNNRSYPIHRDAYEDAQGKTPAKVEFDHEGRPLDHDLKVKEGFWSEQEKWINTVGKKILPIRKFWYSGELYSHMDMKGSIGNTGLFAPEDTDWYKIHSSTYADNVRKTNGDKYLEVVGGGKGVSVANSSIDHLEVFLPRNAGKIRGNFQK